MKPGEETAHDPRTCAGAHCVECNTTAAGDRLRRSAAAKKTAARRRLMNRDEGSVG